MPAIRRGSRARATRRSNSAESMRPHGATDQPRKNACNLRNDAENVADNSTDMNPLLRDLCQHQAWADALHWRAIEAHPSAGADQAIRNRLHHIHMVQRAFVWAVDGRTGAPPITSPEEFGSLAELKRYARGSLKA